MSIHTTRTVTTTRVEVEVPSPCMAGDLDDARAIARAQVPDGLKGADDEYRIEARDDRIVFVIDIDEQPGMVRHVALAEVADALDTLSGDISNRMAVNVPAQLRALADKVRGALS